ncbi:MAG TPA: hypothetical protein VF148_07115 [Acidimicrobiia bacterium]
MRDLRQTCRIVVVLVVLGLITVSCGPNPANESAAPETSTTILSGAGSDYGLPQGDETVDLEPSEFTVEIDNPYWPMEPGSQWVYREIDEDGNALEVVVTVTADTKEIANGVTARVVRDTVTEDGELIEDTFDWYAQDSAGAIWYLGEDTAEFEDGEITSTAGSFEAGADGALPGIIMPAKPADEMRYRQEYYQGEAEDNGEILSIHEQAEVPAGHYEDAILTKDTITIEPDVLEYKLYARGVGPVLVFGVSGEGGREELIDFHQVDEAIAQAAGTTPLGEPYLDE